MPAPVASINEMPQLWEVVGTDVFEYEHEEKKDKFILWRDRASGYAFLSSIFRTMREHGNPMLHMWSLRWFNG